MPQVTQERLREKTILGAWESFESPAERPYVRKYKRKGLRIPTCLHFKDSVIHGQTDDISPVGLRVVGGGLSLKSGTPLALKFAFGGNVCYLNISAQVVYSFSEDQQASSSTIGIKFSDIQEWEQIILLSLVDELIRTAPTREQSLLTIIVSRDSLAEEAARFVTNGATPIHDHGIDDNLRSDDTVLLAEPRPTWVTEDLPPFSAISQFSAVSEAATAEIEISTFPLLIRGYDVDTGQYKYVVPADKVLADPKTAMRMLRELRFGRVPVDYKNWVFARYCVGTKETNVAAMAAAYEASQEFRYFSLSKRFKIAADIHERLCACKDRLIELMILEGHPQKLAEWEFFGMDQIYRKPSLDFYKRHLSQRIGIAGGEVLYWKRKPDGVVCVSPPRNAPCSSSIIAGFALLGGNTLIIKPPLNLPLSTMFLWRNVVHESLKANDAPPGTLNVVIGNSESIMNQWINSPHVNDILFIGDTKAGLDIGNRAFQHGKKPILELSGNDMMFIWKDAPVEGAAQSLLDGFMGSTQICMVPKKAFVHEDVFEEFQATFLASVKNLRVGLPSDPTVCLSPVVKMAEFFDFLEDAMAKGADLLCGGYRINYHGQLDDNGAFLAPAVLRIKDLSNAYRMRCVHEENFFPLIPLIRVSAPHTASAPSGKDQAIFKKMVTIANGNEYGLRISAWVTSPSYLKKFAEDIQNSGLLRINSRHVGFPPYMGTHGGTGKSGGPFGELNYVWQKTTHLQGVSLKKVTKRGE